MISKIKNQKAMFHTLEKKAIFLYAIIIVGCKTDKLQELPIKEISIVQKINDQLNDSTFVGQVTGITYYKNQFFVSDYETGQILILDNQLNLIRKMGIKGKGPMEMLHAFDVFVNNDTIYHSDPGRNSLLAYSLDGQCLKSIKLPNRQNGRFALDGSGNVFFSGSIEIPIQVFNYRNQSIKGFGRIKPSTGYYKGTGMSDYHVVKKDNHLICIAQFYPILYRYLPDGQLVDSCDLSVLPVFSESIKAIEQLQQQSKWNFYFFIDAYLFCDKLFLLCKLFTPGEPMQASKCVLLELNVEDSIKPVMLYTFAGEEPKPYMRFCIFEQNKYINMLTYNPVNKEFHKFILQ